MSVPEPAELAGHPEPAVRIRAAESIKRGTEIVVLTLEFVRPLPLARDRIGIRGRRKLLEEGRVTISADGLVSGRR